MKKFVAWLLVLALTAAVSIGATLAYLTDTDEDVNVMTLGKVKIDQLEYERVDTETKDAAAVVQKFHDNKPLFPAVTDKDNFDWETNEGTVDWEQIGKDGYTSTIWDPARINNEVDKMVFVKNKGDYDAFVRSIFAFEAGNYETLDEYLKNVHLNLNDTDWNWEWAETPVTIGESTYFVATATYNKVLNPGALTEISLSQIALDSSATNEDVKAFGDTFQVLVKSQGIQAEGFPDADTALNEGFGEILINKGTEESPIPEVDSDNIPWTDDSPFRGTDLRTALHYLNGNKAGTKITAKVTNVIFGLNKDYAGIVDKYDGTLVDVEQDVPVYSYYVPNGSNYDVYFLADDMIYSPKDSTALFKKMSALKTVDTDNFDVSRTTIMYEMFMDCSKLTTIDVNNWDVSNVTTMFSLMDGCKALKQFDVSKWDTGNVTTMQYMFYGCRVLEALDVSGWDLRNATDLRATFYNCNALTELDVSDWQVGNVTNMAFTFAGCLNITHLDVADWDVGSVVTFNSFLSDTSSNKGNMKLQSIDVSKWDIGNVEHMGWMFYGCGSLTELDLSGLDVSKVANFWHTFADCYSLTKIDFTDWNTASVQTVNGMFNNCNAMTVIDVSEFDTQTLTDAGQLFESCYSLERVVGLEKWDTSNVTNMQQMFQSSSKLVEVDLSAFDTSSLKDVQVMFNGCSALKTVYVSDLWDMSKVTASGKMFAGCVQLVGGNGTVWSNEHTNVEYARIDTPEAPGYLTHINDKP